MHLNIVEESSDEVVEHLDGDPAQPLPDLLLAAEAAARGVVEVEAAAAANARLAGARRPEDEAVGLHRRDGRRGPGRGRCNKANISCDVWAASINSSTCDTLVTGEENLPSCKPF